MLKLKKIFADAKQEITTEQMNFYWKKESVVKSMQQEYNICRVNKQVNLGCATTL